MVPVCYGSLKPKIAINTTKRNTNKVNELRITSNIRMGPLMLNIANNKPSMPNAAREYGLNSRKKSLKPPSYVTIVKIKKTADNTEKIFLFTSLVI